MVKLVVSHVYQYCHDKFGDSYLLNHGKLHAWHKFPAKYSVVASSDFRHVSKYASLVISFLKPLCAMIMIYAAGKRKDGNEGSLE